MSKSGVICPKLASGEWIGSFALSEANSGSDALAAETRAVLSDDGTHYVLNGIKMLDHQHGIRPALHGLRAE